VPLSSLFPNSPAKRGQCSVQSTENRNSQDSSERPDTFSKLPREYNYRGLKIIIVPSDLSLVGTDGSTVSSLNCDCWPMLGLDRYAQY